VEQQRVVILKWSRWEIWRKKLCGVVEWWKCKWYWNY